MFIISEPSFTATNWYFDIISGLKSSARRKRETLEYIKNIDDIADLHGECICVIGSAHKWLFDTVRIIKNTGNHAIIIGNTQKEYFFTNCSYVSSSIKSAVEQSLNLFSQNGKTNTALYGINNDSVADIYRKQTFCSLQNENCIFNNNGSLSSCFDEFYNAHKIKPFDSVLCANDYAAVSLMRHLENCGEKISDFSIIGYSNSILSQFVRPALTSISINYKEFGKAAFIIRDHMTNNPKFSGINIEVECNIIERQTTDFTKSGSPLKVNADIPNSSSMFYNDNELKNILGVDRLLESCDSTDYTILNLLYHGKTLDEICESSFLSENALKYRIKKFKELCHKESLDEIKNILNYCNIIIPNK